MIKYECQVTPFLKVYTDTREALVEALNGIDVFIETNRIKEKIRLLSNYAEVRPAVPTQTSVETPKEAPKPLYEKCPECGRNSLKARKIVSDKQGRFISKVLGREIKMGDMFKECLNKDCKKIMG